MCDLNSEDVNAFLSSIAAESFTAKDFRTWIGTREAAISLANSDVGRKPTEKRFKEVWQNAVGAASETLQNTVAVARSSYIHPAINSPAALEFLRDRLNKEGYAALPNLTRIETALIDFLEL